MSLTAHQLTRISERKIFNELELHHVQKVGIKRFWAQEAEMNQTAISSLETARGKFFMNSTHIRCGKQESNICGLRRAS